jgi:hypothetical protein
LRIRQDNAFGPIFLRKREESAAQN